MKEGKQLLEILKTVLRSQDNELSYASSFYLYLISAQVFLPFTCNQKSIVNILICITVMFYYDFVISYIKEIKGKIRKRKLFY